MRLSRVLGVSVVVVLVSAVAACAQTEPEPEITLNIVPWLEAAKNQLMYMVNQAGSLLFTILAAIVGLNLVMRMVAAVAKK